MKGSNVFFGRFLPQKYASGRRYFHALSRGKGRTSECLASTTDRMEEGEKTKHETRTRTNEERTLPRRGSISEHMHKSLLAFLPKKNV